MYKTVRHGENSLQYKILAQQEEGVTNIRYRKSPRTVTGKLITVIVLLIIGIIASAVLVPLVLTNDFIALTGTFQKFSVSTLRRSHSGNHVVVIAKKPYGWNAPHSSAPPKQPIASLATNSNAKQTTVITRLLDKTSTPEPTTTVKPTEATKAAIPSSSSSSSSSKVTSDRPAGDKHTDHSPMEATADSARVGQGVAQNSNPFFPLKVNGGPPTKPPTTSPALQPLTSSPPSPAWFDPVKKWDLVPSDNFITGMNGVVTNPVSVLGSFLLVIFVVVVVVMFVILKKSLPKRKTSAEKESAETKEHRTRLLKPSGSSDHDEE